ncbi:MAG: response regulator [Chitinophagaceae bacterium]|nr:MAG: response regulator [Chitinophagaceae bacterium]
MQKEIKILLIEDSREYARLMIELLNESSLSGFFEITNCIYLADGIETLKKEKFDLIVLDLNLPDSVGFDAIRKINELELNLPIIIQTGYEDPEEGISGFQTGVQDYLVKGEYDGNLLAKSIRYAIERHNLQKELQNYAARLKKSEEKLLDAQEIAKIGNWELRTDDLSMAWSNEIYNIFEKNKADFEPDLETLLKLTHPNDRDFLDEIINHSLKHESEFNIDFRIVTGEETRKLKYINLRLKSVKDKAKKIIGTIQDISSRKEIEEALIKSEEKYHTLFEASRDPIYITTKDGRFIDFNNSMLELFGYTREELKNLDVRILYKNPFERQKFKKEIELKGYVRDFEVILHTKKGTPLNCLVTSTLWKANDGSHYGYQGIVRDITEVKKNENLKREKEIAQRSAKLKEQFLANMSHEIRTPLNAISGMNHLLRNTELNERQKQYLDSISTSVEHLLELINDILDFSKIEAGKLVLEEEDFNLVETINRVFQTIEFKSKEKKIKLIKEISSDIPTYLKGDVLRLNQIFFNLLGNALKFTNKGYVKLSVKATKFEGDKAWLEFKITDTGIGIPKEKIEFIFNSFTQIHQHAKQVIEGTGLGLAITNKLIELLGGKISVKSQVGIGSEFTFNIPFLVRKNAPLNQNNDKVNDKISIYSPAPHVRILIAEDKKLNQVVLTETLKTHWPDISLDIADNGKIALQKLRESRYDLIIMDVQMPEMDGLETTKTIRSNNEFREIKDISILALTAYATTGEAEKCLQSGMNAYISKPFEPDYLFEKIVELLPANKKIMKKSESSFTAEKSNQLINTSIDLNYLDKISKNNEVLKQKIIDLLIKETPEELDMINKYLREKNAVSLGKAAHKLKSAAVYLGVEKTKKEIEEVENIALNSEEPDWAILTDKISVINHTIDILLAQLVKTKKQEI